MGSNLQLTLAAELASLTAFQEFVDKACKTANVEDKTCYDIKLAVDEACTNIIQHGYKGLKPGSIILSLQIGKMKIVVRITDFGHTYEPSEPLQPDAQADFESGKLGGYGLYFMYRSMDEISYQASSSGNTLTMIKHMVSAKSDSNEQAPRKLID